MDRVRLAVPIATLHGETIHDISHLPKGTIERTKTRITRLNKLQPVLYRDSLLYNSNSVVKLQLDAVEICADK